MRASYSSPIACRSAVLPSIAGLLVLAGTSAPAAEPTAASQYPTYTWSAELVAFDKTANTVTVKSRLVSEAPNVAGLKPGDAAMLAWSGVASADGVRSIERGSKSSSDRMAMPVVFVASEDGRDVSFKVPIPAEDSAVLGKVQPGQWVTATSPQKPKSAKDAVTSIAPYADKGDADVG